MTLTVNGAYELGELRRLIDEIRAGTLTPPDDLMDLLTQAVAARKARQGEDVEAWAKRIAAEAAGL